MTMLDNVSKRGNPSIEPRNLGLLYPVLLGAWRPIRDLDWTGNSNMWLGRKIHCKKSRKSDGKSSFSDQYYNWGIEWASFIPISAGMITDITASQHLPTRANQGTPRWLSPIQQRWKGARPSKAAAAKIASQFKQWYETNSGSWWTWQIEVLKKVISHNLPLFWQGVTFPIGPIVFLGGLL